MFGKVNFFYYLLPCVVGTRSILWFKGGFKVWYIIHYFISTYRRYMVEDMNESDDEG